MSDWYGIKVVVGRFTTTAEVRPWNPAPPLELETGPDGSASVGRGILDHKGLDMTLSDLATGFAMWCDDNGLSLQQGIDKAEEFGEELLFVAYDRKDSLPPELIDNPPESDEFG